MRPETAAKDREAAGGRTDIMEAQQSFLRQQGKVDRCIDALIDAVVEGSGDIPLGSGLLQELQDALRSLSPEIATLSDDESGEDVKPGFEDRTAPSASWWREPT